MGKKSTEKSRRYDSNATMEDVSAEKSPSRVKARRHIYTEACDFQISQVASSIVHSDGEISSDDASDEGFMVVSPSSSLGDYIDVVRKCIYPSGSMDAQVSMSCSSKSDQTTVIADFSSDVMSFEASVAHGYAQNNSLKKMADQHALDCSSGDIALENGRQIIPPNLFLGCNPVLANLIQSSQGADHTMSTGTMSSLVADQIAADTWCEPQLSPTMLQPRGLNVCQDSTADRKSTIAAGRSTVAACGLSCCCTALNQLDQRAKSKIAAGHVPLIGLDAIDLQPPRADPRAVKDLIPHPTAAGCPIHKYCEVNLTAMALQGEAGCVEHVDISALDPDILGCYRNSSSGSPTGKSNGKPLCSVISCNLAPSESNLETQPRVKLRHFNVGSSVNNTYQVPSEISKKSLSKWGCALVGYFLDKRLSFHQVKLWAHKTWDENLEEVASNDNGFFIFKFKNEGTLNRILEHGPYYIGGKLIILKKWSPGMKLSKCTFSSIPLWIHFYNVPLDLWSEEGLGYIGSIIGNPLYLDETTQKGCRLNFARICVEVEASLQVPQSVCLDLGYGEPHEIKIEVPWSPKKCNECNIFGHSSMLCPKKPKVTPKQAWKVKEGEGIPPPQKKVATSKSTKEWVEVSSKKGKEAVNTTPKKIETPLRANESSSSNMFNALSMVNDEASTPSYVEILKTVVTPPKANSPQKEKSNLEEGEKIPQKEIPIEESVLVVPIEEIIQASPFKGDSSSREDNKRKLHEKLQVYKDSRAKAVANLSIKPLKSCLKK